MFRLSICRTWAHVVIGGGIFYTALTCVIFLLIVIASMWQASKWTKSQTDHMRGQFVKLDWSPNPLSILRESFCRIFDHERQSFELASDEYPDSSWMCFPLSGVTSTLFLHRLATNCALRDEIIGSFQTIFDRLDRGSLCRNALVSYHNSLLNLNQLLGFSVLRSSLLSEHDAKVNVSQKALKSAAEHFSSLTCAQLHQLMDDFVRRAEVKLSMLSDELPILSQRLNAGLFSNLASSVPSLAIFVNKYLHHVTNVDNFIDYTLESTFEIGGLFGEALGDDRVALIDRLFPVAGNVGNSDVNAEFCSRIETRLRASPQIGVIAISKMTVIPLGLLLLWVFLPKVVCGFRLNEPLLAFVLVSTASIFAVWGLSSLDMPSEEWRLDSGYNIDGFPPAILGRFRNLGVALSHSLGIEKVSLTVIVVLSIFALIGVYQVGWEVQFADLEAIRRRLSARLGQKLATRVSYVQDCEALHIIDLKKYLVLSTEQFFEKSEGRLLETLCGLLESLYGLCCPVKRLQNSLHHFACVLVRCEVNEEDRLCEGGSPIEDYVLYVADTSSSRRIPAARFSPHDEMGLCVRAEGSRLGCALRRLMKIPRIQIREVCPLSCDYQDGLDCIESKLEYDVQIIRAADGGILDRQFALRSVYASSRRTFRMIVVAVVVALLCYVGYMYLAASRWDRVIRDYFEAQCKIWEYGLACENAPRTEQQDDRLQFHQSLN